MDIFDPKALWFLGSIPLILAVVQMIKQWVTDARWYAPISIAVGIGLNVLIGHLIGQPISLCVLAGIIAALTANGTYSTYTTYKKP